VGGGRSSIHRLNRVEYTNAIRDLLDLEIDGQSLLPGDSASYGFDNIADVLTISPMLLEKYLDAAQAIIAQAVPSQPRVVAENILQGRQFITIKVDTTDKSQPAPQGYWTAK